MSDSTIHNLTDIATAGGVASTDLLYAVRPGSPDADYRVNAGALAALAAPFNPATHAVVAKGGVIPSTNSDVTGYTRAERRSVATVGGQPVKSIRLVFYNGYVTLGEHNAANSCTIEFGLENPGASQTVMATFGGQPTIALAPGAKAVSDPIYPSQFGLPYFPAGWQPFVRTGVVIPSTSSTFVYPNGGGEYQAPASGNFAVGSNSATSQISNTGALTIPTGGQSNGASAIYCPGPHMILGEWLGTPDISLYIGGDSIAAGKADSADNGTVGGGFIINGVRSVSGRTIPSVMFAVYGEKAQNWSANGNAFRTWAMQFCTHLIGNEGTNDITAGVAEATVLPYKQAIWTSFRANAKTPAHISDVPIAPLTTTIDAWATTTNQTPATGYAVGGTRDTLNVAVIGLVGTNSGPDEVVNTNPSFQASSPTSDWVVNGTADFPTTDGIHPSPALNLLATPIVNAVAQSWRITGTNAVATAPSVEQAQIVARMSTQFQHWRAGLGRVRSGNGNATILCVGDSTTLGVGSNGTGTGNLVANSYPSQLANLLNSTGVPALANGTLGAGFGIPFAANDGRLSVGSSWTYSPGNKSVGGCLYTASSNTTGAAWSFTPTNQVDTFDLYYIQGPSTGSLFGSLTYDINGSGTTTLNTNNGSGSGSVVAKVTFTGTLGTNTVNIKWASGAAVYILGVNAYNSAKKTVNIINSGWSGSSSTDWGTTGPTFGPVPGITAIGADLTLIGIGINDWNLPLVLPTYISDMQNMITAGLAAGDVALICPVPSNPASAAAVAVQQTFINSIYALAASNNIPIIDHWNRWRSWTISNALGLYYDALHPNGTGYADNAQNICHHLLNV